MADSWLIDGNCKECRRKNYCSKPCTKAKQRKQQAISRVVNTAVSRHLGLDIFYDVMRKGLEG